MDEFPFNEVDNLILSELVYMDWDGIVPVNGKSAVTLKSAVERYFKRTPRLSASLGLIVPDSIFDLAIIAAGTRRFADLRLCSYVNSIEDKTPMQFAAMTVAGAGDTDAVVYRGTDDTIAGWQENFNMSFMETVPAQTRALEYLKKQSALHPGRELLICGHSKGGNLAVYAACNCGEDIQKRIRQVYNNDGPGFLLKPTQYEGYRKIQEKIYTIVPQNSIVGVLMEHVDPDTVVTSSVTGAAQHDGMTWQVYGTQFIHAPELTQSSRQTEETMHSLLYNMNMQDRRELVEGLFGILWETSSRTLTELSHNRNKTARVVIDHLKAMDDAKKERMTSIIRLVLRGQANSIGNSLSALTQGIYGNKT